MLIIVDLFNSALISPVVFYFSYLKTASIRRTLYVKIMYAYIKTTHSTDRVKVDEFVNGVESCLMPVLQSMGNFIYMGVSFMSAISTLAYVTYLLNPNRIHVVLTLAYLVYYFCIERRCNRLYKAKADAYYKLSCKIFSIKRCLEMMMNNVEIDHTSRSEWGYEHTKRYSSLRKCDSFVDLMSDGMLITYILLVYFYCTEDVSMVMVIATHPHLSRIQNVVTEILAPTEHNVKTDTTLGRVLNSVLRLSALKDGPSKDIPATLHLEFPIKLPFSSHMVNIDRTEPRMNDGCTLGKESTVLDIEHGDRVLVLGPSGCGKSTVLQMMLGMLDWNPDRYYG